MSLIYVASPYTHENSRVVQQRVTAATLYCGQLIAEHLHPWSPIVHSHSIASICDLPTDWEFWKAADELLIRKSDVMHVLMFPGWMHSRGIEAEVEIANLFEKPVRMIPEKDTCYEQAASL